MFIRTEFNYNAREEGRKVALDCGKAIDGADGKLKPGDATPSLAKQSFKDECDINTIVRRFGLTGELPSDVRIPLNGDFQDLPDFQSAMNLVVAAREAFDQMPSHVRNRFHNNPVEFVDWASKKDNHEEAVKLGLAMPKDAAAKAAQAALEARAADQVALEVEVAKRRPKAAAAAPSTGST